MKSTIAKLFVSQRPYQAECDEFWRICLNINIFGPTGIGWKVGWAPPYSGSRLPTGHDPGDCWKVELCFRVQANITFCAVDERSFRHLSVQAFHERLLHLHLEDWQPVRSSFTRLSFMLIPPVSTTLTEKPSLAVSSVTILWISFASSRPRVEG